MSTSALPGVVWVVIILALIPGVQSVLERFFPSTEYWYTALIIALLTSVAKGIEVWARQQGMKIEIDEPTVPAAMAQPMSIEVQQPSNVRRWLLG